MAFNLLFIRRIHIFILCVASLSSCSLFNSDVIIPSYIHIDKVSFIPGDTTLEGSSSTNISDAWVYLDDQPVGAYETPVTFPVQYEGTHTIKIGGGIKMNGIGATRVIYPFYQLYSGTITLTPKQTTIVTPSVKYYPGINFSYIEDFEGAGYCLTDTFGDTRLQTVTGPAAWGGGKSVYTKMNVDSITFQARTCSTYVLNGDGHAKFIELNYKCNHSFVVGLVFSSATSPVLGINPSNGWNKVYINITDLILVSGSYGIYIAMQRFPSDTEDPELTIDNLKLIHN